MSLKLQLILGLIGGLAWFWLTISVMEDDLRFRIRRRK